MAADMPFPLLQNSLVNSALLVADGGTTLSKEGCLACLAKCRGRFAAESRHQRLTWTYDQSLRNITAYMAHARLDIATKENEKSRVFLALFYNKFSLIFAWMLLKG